jgi:hypothetical protein
MSGRIFIVSLTALLMTGCYKVTVETGAPPAPDQIDIPWQMSFAAGLIPPSEVETQDRCPEGISRVETKRSFLNGLATAVTNNNISPLHVTVTCAAGPVTSPGGSAPRAEEPEETSPPE